METNRHLALKYLALQWLYQKGCKHIALELKFGKYIFDVIGTDGENLYIIEAKQAKEDFIKDYNSPDEIKNNIEKYRQLFLESGEKDYKKKMEYEREKSWKFFDPMFSRLSTERYIIAPDSMLDGYDTNGWGILNEEPRITSHSEKSTIDKSYIHKIINEISKKNTKMYLKSIGVDFDSKSPIFPDWKLHL